MKPIHAVVDAVRGRNLTQQEADELIAVIRSRVRVDPEPLDPNRWTDEMIAQAVKDGRAWVHSDGRVSVLRFPAPVAQEPPTDPWAAVGLKPEDCRCIVTRPSRNGANGPEPAEWEKADDCPLHSLPVAQEPHSRACGVGWHYHGKDCHPNCPTCHGTVGPVRPAPGSAQEPHKRYPDAESAHEADEEADRLEFMGAQEPADPPWLTEAIRAGWAERMAYPDASDAIRRALPILRAGIEQELREKLDRAADIVRGQS